MNLPVRGLAAALPFYETVLAWGAQTPKPGMARIPLGPLERPGDSSFMLTVRTLWFTIFLSMLDPRTGWAIDWKMVNLLHCQMPQINPCEADLPKTD